MENQPLQNYVLGHSPQEIRRLKVQASRIDPTTRRFFAAAGIAEACRVLDVGTGVGDVAFLTKELVGERGSVLGIDRSAVAIAEAQRRAAERREHGVSFILGDPGQMEFDRAFDAVVGRYVLQFQRDPVALLRKLASHVRPGGIIVFHELDWAGLHSFPEVKTFSRCCAWGVAGLKHSGTEMHMGGKLHASFHAADLGSPHMLFEAQVGGGSNAGVIISTMVGIIETLLPAIERAGAATADEVDVGTLAQRMQTEVNEAQAFLIGHHQIAAWVRV